MNGAFNKALQLHQSGNFIAAENGYRSILVESPQDVTVLYHLGIVLHQQAKMDEARQTLEEVTSIAADFPEAHFSLGAVLMELTDYDASEVAFRRALELRQDMYGALVRLGELLVLKKQYAEAVPYLKKSLQLRNDDVKSWGALAESLKHLGDFEEAIEAAKSALKIEGSEERHSQLANIIYLLYREDPEKARMYARSWIEEYPNSAFSQHMGAAILGLSPPERANDSYVKELFDGFASTFEEQLTTLGYHTPDIVSHVVTQDAEEGSLVILDAGCGTGLAAHHLRPVAKKLVGVDISPGMLEKAAEKNLYDELIEMELVEYLRTTKDSFNTIVAADVFNYFGDLKEAIDCASQSLLPGGHLVFSAECSDKADGTDGFMLGAHGRYSHNKRYITELIEQAGLSLIEMPVTVLRKEFGADVTAYIVVADKPQK